MKRKTKIEDNCTKSAAENTWIVQGENAKTCNFHFAAAATKVYIFIYCLLNFIAIAIKTKKLSTKNLDFFSTVVHKRDKRGKLKEREKHFQQQRNFTSI